MSTSRMTLSRGVHIIKCCMDPRLVSTMGLFTWNSIRALDFVCGHAQPDHTTDAIITASKR